MAFYALARELHPDKNTSDPHAATKWTTAAQTPRVFVPWLTPQMGWWDASKFALSEKLEKAWEMGEQAHPPDAIIVRSMSDSEVKPKKAAKAAK
mgnify:CR=1 FL=1